MNGNKTRMPTATTNGNKNGGACALAGMDRASIGASVALHVSACCAIWAFGLIGWVAVCAAVATVAAVAYVLKGGAA